MRTGNAGLCPRVFARTAEASKGARLFLRAQKYSYTSVELYVNTVTPRPPSANPKNETTGFTACHLQRARPHVLISKPCHEPHGEPRMAPAPPDPLLPPARPGERLTGTTRRFSRGPSLPFHRRGKLKQRELQQQQHAQTRSRIRTCVIARGGPLLPRARCRLVRGMAPPAHPIITFPPSLQKNIS